MADYIKRIDVMTICERYSQHCFESSDSRGQDIADRILDDVCEIPTADVVEVKHGEWIEDGYVEKPCVCSYCGEEAQYISKFNETFDYDWEENLQSTGYEETREYIRTPYCPNCGAKMDGERK